MIATYTSVIKDIHFPETARIAEFSFFDAKPSTMLSSEVASMMINEKRSSARGIGGIIMVTV